MLEMSALRTNASWKSFTPLVSGHVDNVLVKIAPDLNRLLFQFVNSLWISVG